ncbi:dihydrodipicolinate synthase family protein [Microbacterium sp. X-17]|uniref:dihydrodipicolinate synthase family protein n=1 Tax=Microbacterium sp. X-17 TaxID=3144404 RepID=UPI0031F4EC11
MPLLDFRKIRMRYLPSGVIPACLLPFQVDYSIDEAELRRHLQDLISTRGVTAITTVAHASEVASLSDTEQIELLDITVDEAAGRLPVIAGVYDTSNRGAAHRAQIAAKHGASAVLAFPSAAWDMGHDQKPEIAFNYIRDVAEASELPVIVFVYPKQSGLHISTPNLMRICAEIDNVVAIKDWSNDIVTYEDNFRSLKALEKDVRILSSFSLSLLPTLAIGADGILSGHGSMVATLHVALFEAMEAGNLPAAREIAAALHPLTRSIYAPPFLDGHNRMKNALQLSGRLQRAVVRPPLEPIDEPERARIADVLARVGLISPPSDLETSHA